MMPKFTQPLAEDLREASFRGVKFFVEQGDHTAGRRTQVHEYPQRDDPYVEDVGRATREFNLTAFMVGPTYVDDANALLFECEKAGAGQLVHPWLGSISVTLKEPAKVSYSMSLGKATIELSFVEAGKYVFVAQKIEPATAKNSQLAADKLKAANAKKFDKKFDTSKWPDFVALAAAVDIDKIFSSISMTNIPGLSVLGFVNTALSSVRSLQLLIADPAALRAQFVSLLGLTDVLGQITTGIDLVNAIKELSQSDSFAPVTAPASGGEATDQQYANTNALNELARLSLLAEAVGLSSLVDVTVHDDAIELRDKLSNAIDAEAANATDEVYEALVDARTAVWLDLTARSKNSARLTTITPPEVMPMLAIAYDYYGDATRETEIIKRNKARHPMLVPVQPLKVVAI